MKAKNIIDLVNYVKKLNREEEIKSHGKTLHPTKIKKSKKIYSRKNKWSAKELQ